MYKINLRAFTNSHFIVRGQHWTRSFSCARLHLNSAQSAYSAKSASSTNSDTRPIRLPSTRWILTASALILVFAGPPILANFLYQQREHFQFKKMNTGELQTEPKSIESYGLSNDEFQGHWQLLYITPKDCDAACHQQMELLRNIQISLGKDQNRLHLRNVPMDVVTKKVVTKDVTPKDVATKLTTNSAWIVDPKGFMILYYSQDILKQHPKGLLEDIRRLVRFSHANTR